LQRDRELCEAWMERAAALDPAFLDGVDPRSEPWDRVVGVE